MKKLCQLRPWLKTKPLQLASSDVSIVLTLGSPTAVVNGIDTLMPLAPQVQNGRTMVPLRFILERFGAKVGWNPSTYEISVTSPVLKQGLTAEQMLGRITEAMSSEGRYKMKADTTMQMEINADGQTQNVDMSGQVNASHSGKPTFGLCVHNYES